MTKQKKQSEKLLAFLLILGFAGGNSNASTPGAPPQSADKTKSPATGDTLPVMLYTLLAIASGSIMLKIYSRKKRPTHI